jgi:glutathione synthase/RimK-type ligase-like ATP-grasp enzyme
MLVGIYDLKDPNGKELAVNKTYERILAYNGIPSIRLRAEQTDFWEKIDSLSLFIMRFSHHDSHLQQARDLLPIIEHTHGVKCYPNYNTGWHYDDKIKQYLLLRHIGFPIVKTWICWERDAALEFVEKASYPLVFKLRGGAGSQNVILIKDRRHARKLVKRMFGKGIHPERFLGLESVRFKHLDLYREFHHLLGNINRWNKGLGTRISWQIQKNYVLFQQFLPGNAWDTRVTIIGDRGFAFRRLVRDNDFRASGSGKIDYDPAKIDINCIEIAFQVSREMGFQSMAYDFLRNEENKPEFCEVSYTYVSSAVRSCPGFWDPNLKWHSGTDWWPEHLHLIDALSFPDLKIPLLK